MKAGQVSENLASALTGDTVDRQVFVRVPLTIADDSGNPRIIDFFYPLSGVFTRTASGDIIADSTPDARRVSLK